MNSPLQSHALPPRQGISYSAVPKILLGSGAFCLLVAAAIFLAVSWSTMGIGGRTAVLAGLTLTAAVSTLALHHRGLRVAAEAISAVSLGLLALDAYGAAGAGLLGDLDDAAVTLLAGGLLAAGGAAYALATAGNRLTAPQVATGVGLGLAYLGGTSSGSGHHYLIGHLALLLASAAAWASRRTGLRVQQWSCLGAALLAWLGATGTATGNALADPTLHQLWVDGSGWALLVSAAGLLVPAAVLRDERMLLAGASGSALVVTTTLTLPVVGTSATTVYAVALAVTVVWLGVLAAVVNRLRTIAVAPAAIGTAIVAVGLIQLTATDLLRWAHVLRPFGQPFLVELRHPGQHVDPLLAIPSVLVITAALALGIAGRGRPDLRVWAPVAAIAAGLGGAITAAAYDVPLAVASGVLAATAALAGVLATRTGQAAYAGVAVLAIAAGVLGALPSAGLTAAVAGAGLVTAAWLALDTRPANRLVGELALVPTAALTVIGLAQLGHDGGWIAVPVLLATGVLALLRPVEWIEIPAFVVSLLVLPFSLADVDQPLAVLSLWLITAGCLSCASALIHTSRRPLAFVGGVLMLFGAWVRLADWDVHTAEAYTLPLAAALIALGLFQLQRRPAAGTAETLLPGLLLATVPSLLLSWADPLSARALVLGAACLVLVLAGSTVRWSAPVLTGTTIGLPLVLRELGPYAGTVPQWVWIGLAGLLLTVAGITWERQLRDLRRAVSMIGRLR